MCGFQRRGMTANATATSLYKLWTGIQDIKVNIGGESHGRQIWHECTIDCW
jgi:hypothetical protein